MTWVKADPNEDMIRGVRYRTQLTVNAPYSDGIVAGVVRVLKFGEGVAESLLRVAGHNIQIEDVFIVPPDPNKVYGRTPQWGIGVVFRKTGDNTPLHLLVGAIILIVTTVLGFTIVTKTYEKEFVEPSVELVQGTLPLVLAGVLLLAVWTRG